MRKLAIACYAGTWSTFSYLFMADAAPLPGTAFEVIFGSLPPLDVLLVLLTRAGLVFGFVTVIVWYGLTFASREPI